MTDRRTTDRLPLRLYVNHILGEDEQCLCVTEDVSVDGMRLVRVHEGAWGNPRHVWLQFELPDDGPAIRALGELCYEDTTPGQAPVRGFRFKYLNPHARRRFARFVDQQVA
ncbi:MAG: PilZ domain-containing protein [bacterium]